jgi:hypothetical protein
VPEGNLTLLSSGFSLPIGNHLTAPPIALNETKVALDLFLTFPEVFGSLSYDAALA